MLVTRGRSRYTAVSMVLAEWVTLSLEHGATFETVLWLKVEVKARSSGWNRPHSRAS